MNRIKQTSFNFIVVSDFESNTIFRVSNLERKPFRFFKIFQRITEIDPPTTGS